MSERDDSSGSPPLRPPDSVGGDVSAELTAELGADQIVQNLGTSRIWSFRPDQVVAARYRIVRSIGRGGMGEVYEVEDLELGGRVALKTIRAEAAAHETLLWRFRREIQIARRVTHPNVCRLFDVSYHVIEIVGSEQLNARLMCVSMELLQGETLAQKLARDGAMSPAEALPLARQLAAGLSAAHAAGVVHRDFKSANVILAPLPGDADERGVRVVITDFGLARRIESSEQDGSLTDSGVVVGTPAYMAPEQFEGRDATAASDVYSFGVVLFEMVTGRRPFDGATPISQAIQRLKSAAPSPARFCNDLDPVWESAILRCLEPDPRARFATPLEVVAALEGQGVARGGGRSRNKTLRRQRVERMAATFFIVAVSIATGFGVYRLVTRVPRTATSIAEAATVIAVRPGAAVIEFKNLSGKSEDLWMSTAFAEMIRTELSAGGRLRVTSGDDVARAQRELALQGSDTYSKETLARVGESLGADYVVAGSYVALGTGDETRLRFDVRVQDARSGETITAISESGAESDLLAMVSSAGTKLRGAFGQGSLDTARAAGLAASRPQNPEVVRLYAEGISLLRDFDALGAKSRLEQAATIEPDFALAHGALAEAWSTLGYDARAAEQAQRAFELSKTLGREESLAIEGRLRAIRKEWKKAADVYAVLHGFVPDDLEYGIRLAEARATAGDQAGASEAIRDLRALEAPLSSDPRIDIAEADCARARGDRSAVARLAMAAVEKGKARGATLLVARAQLLLGWAQRVASEYAEAIATLESARSAYAKHGDAGGAALADVQAGIAMFYMGDFEHARARFEPAKVMCTRIGWRSCEASILNSLAAIAWVEGRYADGQKHLEEGRAIALETADKRAELMARANIAQLEIYRGLSSDGFEHAAAVIEELNAGTASDVLPAAQIASAIARLQQGRIGEGRALLLEAVTNARKASNPRSEAEALSKLAVAHFFDGELDKAAEDLESAAALQRRMREKAAEADSLTRLAAVRIAQGRLDEADRILPAARRTLSEQKFLYDWVYASNVTIELALARGKPHEALLTVREIHERAPWIEKPSLRIRLAVTEARILTALGRREEAIGLLEEAGRDADRIDLPLESLGAALALAELQLADPATRKRGVATAQRAKARAAALGLSYFDHKAGQLLAGSSL